MKLTLVDNTQFAADRLNESFNPYNEDTLLSITFSDTTLDVDALKKAFTPENCALLKTTHGATEILFNGYVYVSQINKSVSDASMSCTVTLQKEPLTRTLEN